MATKTLTVVRPGTYATRMLQAGDVYEATGPEARLYVKLGWMSEELVLTPKAPARKRKAQAKKK